MGWTVSEGRRRHRLRVEMFGPRDGLDGVRFQRLRRWVASLRHPWDGLLLSAVALGLLLAAVGGAEVGASPGASIPVDIASGGVLAFAVAIAARLSNFDRRVD